MSIDVSVKSKILKPISEVFYAIIDKNEISKYFTTSSSSDLIEGEKVTWEWSDFCAEHCIEVLKVENEKQVVFNWEATGKTTKVSMNFEALGENETEILIIEKTFDITKIEVSKALLQTQGWTDFVSSLKAYLYTGVNLRNGKMN
ncbi:MAG: SRPBCC domain-containing protein [Flavobacteriaceae bacterium]|nr:SRPBCC domain-containing protein [Flavobacteriaceae bacterium]